MTQGSIRDVLQPKSPKIAQNGILISIAIWFVFDMITLITGMFAKALLTSGDPLFAYPRLGALVLPPLAYGFFITGLLATIMSTIDSLGFINAITFGRDILWRIQSTSKLKEESEHNTIHFVRKGLTVNGFYCIGISFYDSFCCKALVCNRFNTRPRIGDSISFIFFKKNIFNPAYHDLSSYYRIDMDNPR